MMNWKRKITTALCTMAAIYCINGEPTYAQEQESTSKPAISGQIQEQVWSRRVSGSGTVLSEGPVAQTNARIAYGNVSLWGAMYNDLNTEKGPEGMHPNELRTGIDYKQPLTKEFALRAGAGLYFYPDNIMGKDTDKTLELAFCYSDKFKGVKLDTELSELHFFSAGGKEPVDRVTLTAKLGIPVIDIKDWEIVFNPSIRAVYQDFHVNQSKGSDSLEGLCHTTIGAGFGINNGNIGFDIGAYRQEGNDFFHKPDMTYYGVGLKVKF